MMFNSLFIANIAEIAKPLTRLMSPAEKESEIFEDHAYSDRFLFSEDDQRILITPLMSDKDFIADTCTLLGYQHLLVLSPQTMVESTCEAILADKKLLGIIMDLCKKNPGKIKLHAYAATEEFIKLVNFLKSQGLSFQTPELPLPDNLWTTDFFDSKSGFRQTLSNSNYSFPRMPAGVICSAKEEVFGWADYYLKQNSGVVIKYNRGLAGAGLKIFEKSNTSAKRLKADLDYLFKKEAYWLDEMIIVEEYIPPNLKVAGGTPSMELKVTNKGIEVLYACAMRILHSKVFQGIEIGKDVLPESLLRKLYYIGKKFGEVLFYFGYRGFFDIDFVYSQKNKLYPLEANLRRTGGTHVYELAKRLLGNKFEKNYYLVSVLKAETPRFKNKSYAEFKKAVKTFLYPMSGKKEGIIPTVINYLKKGKLGYTVVGSNRQRVYTLEAEFLKRLN